MADLTSTLSPLELTVLGYPFDNTGMDTETLTFNYPVSHNEEEETDGLISFATHAIRAATNSAREMTFIPDMYGRGTSFKRSHLVAAGGTRFWIDVSTSITLRLRKPGSSIQLLAIPADGVESLPRTIEKLQEWDHLKRNTVPLGKEGHEYRHMFLRVSTSGDSKFTCAGVGDSDIDIVATFTVGLYSGSEAARISDILGRDKESES